MLVPLIVTAAVAFAGHANAPAPTWHEALQRSVFPEVPVARGIIVQTQRHSRTHALRVRTVMERAGIRFAATWDLSAHTEVLAFDHAVPVVDAQRIASTIAASPGVAWATPDARKSRAEAGLPNDPRFGEQWDMWDPSMPGGGFGMKAPAAWPVTRGAGAVVAVVDTGITSHPDLDANVLRGYDFVHDAWSGNDGDGRDADASDPGDWVSIADVRAGNCSAEAMGDSSWHGTHVSGTISAVAGNGVGVAGGAPAASILPVRALGKCGGYDSDIIAGILWAAGIAVPGAPTNRTPAQVINLSIGGSQECSPDYQDAIDRVRTRGVTVVAAAGNEGRPVASSEPANCAGVVSVAAIGQSGSLADYSNYGTSALNVTLSAQGGDSPRGADILSTINLGLTAPGSPGYARMAGTSMATPHVSAAAALLYSQDRATTPDQVRARLQASAAPFPPNGGCTTASCGAGILDVSHLFAAPAPPGPVSSLTVSYSTAGATRTARVTWVTPSAPVASAPVTSYVVRFRRAHEAYGAPRTVTQPGITIPGLRPGSLYSLQVAAVSAAGTGPITTLRLAP